MERREVKDLISEREAIRQVITYEVYNDPEFTEFVSHFSSGKHFLLRKMASEWGMARVVGRLPEEEVKKGRDPILSSYDYKLREIGFSDQQDRAGIINSIIDHANRISEFITR